MEPINETTRRKPEFQGGVEVELADSQVWFFPRPYVVYAPNRDDDDGPVRPVWTVGEPYARPRDRSVGEAYGAIRARLETFLAPGAGQRFDVLGIAKVRLDLAKFLLRLNYDLSTAELADMLDLTFDDDTAPPEVLARTEALVELTEGRAPSPKPGGDTTGST
jgi:hypothetical protein